MLNRIKERIHRTKEKLRRLAASPGSTARVDQAPTVSSQERVQANISPAQPPPTTDPSRSEHLDDDARMGLAPAISMPTNTHLVASPSSPELSQVNVSSMPVSTPVPPSLEVANQLNPHPTTVLNLHERKHTTWSGLKALLGVLHMSADAFGPLKSAFDEFSRCIDIFENVAAARKEYTQLRTELDGIFSDISGYLNGDASPSMTPSIVILARGVEKETERTARKLQRSKMEEHAEAMEDVEEVLECYRRIKMLLDRLSLNANTNMWRIVDEHTTQTRLDRLPHSPEAKYQSAEEDVLGRNRCTPNTRVDVLEQLRVWAQDDENQNIYWLNGMAGTGKTTIAYSLCEQLQGAGKLAASFFCSRQLPSCRDVNRILPSIAYQLSSFSRPFRHEVSSALERFSDAHNQPVDLQFESLIAAPLRLVRKTLPVNLIIVIDALDECEHSDRVGKILLALLKHALNLPIKIFVTSRPDPQILDRMGSDEYIRLRSELRLHELEHSVVQSDIRTYLTTSLSGVVLNTADLDNLTTRSGVLFVYASTIVRYLTYDISRSGERLKKVLSMPASSGLGQQDIDALYATILKAALENKSLDAEEQRQVNQVLCTVICAQEPLPVDTIARMSSIDGVESVHAALRPLSSILQVSNTTDQLVTTLHQSFPDYMLDSMRSGRFYCDARKQHLRLTRVCFNLIEITQPSFNICDLECSYILDADAPEFNRRVESSISEHLFYACRYWEAHLELAESPNKLMDELFRFLSTRLFVWTEIMNLKQNSHTSVIILSKLDRWLPSVQASIEARDLAHDAWRFANAIVSGPVRHMTPHIYISILALWPEHRPLSRYQLNRCPNLAEATGSALDRRDTAPLATLNAPGYVLCIACSPDGTRMISGGSNSAIYIWDTHTGQLIGDPLTGHSGYVWHVAFSPDSRRMVSGSEDRTIRVWDTRTGQMLGEPLKGHTNGVRSVAYSPNGAHIVSGSDDRTIRIWVAQTGKMLGQPLEGHTGSVYSVAYSPNAASIVSGSRDKTIRVWDAKTGKLRGLPLKGHTGEIRSVAYSPNGSYIVSGSDDMTVRIWDAETGQMSTKPLQGHTSLVFSVAFSPDGARIVSGSADNTVCIWDAGIGQMLGQPLRGHTDQVYSVAFSPDGLRIISGSHDNTIRIWDAHIGQATGQPPEGHTGAVYSAAYSPDGAHIASGSGDNTICIWNAYTGQMVGRPLKGHASYVLSVAYSLDGTRVASGSHDTTIRIWDASSGQMVGQPLKGHAGAVCSVAFSPDGSRIASGSEDNTVRIWDARTRQMVGQPLKGHTGTVYSVAFSPDGACIVSGSIDQTICIWDANTGQMVGQPLKGHTDWVQSVAYSPSGTHMVSGSDDRTIRIWDARTGEMVGQPLEGHTNWVMSVAYSPDGARIVSGSADKTIRIWDAHTGQMLGQPLEGHTNSVLSVAYSPDGKHIVSGSGDKSIRIWDVCALSNSGKKSSDDPNSIHQPFLSFNTPQPISNDFDTSSRIYEPRTRSGLRVRPNLSDPDAWTLSDDGWVVGHDLKPLLWVPPELRGTLLHYGNTSMISTEGSWALDLSKAKFGTEWQQCYRP